MWSGIISCHGQWAGVIDPTIHRLVTATGEQWSGTRLEFKARFGCKLYFQSEGGHCIGWFRSVTDAESYDERRKYLATQASAARGDITGSNNPMAATDRRKDEQVRITHNSGEMFEGSLKLFADKRGIDPPTYGRMRKTLMGKKVVNGQIVKSFWGWSLAT